MSKYFQQLRNKARTADSVVYKCLLLSKQEYVLEQTVSIDGDLPQSATTWYKILGYVLLSSDCAPAV